MPADISDGIAVVYPANWPQDDIDEPHCTVIYLGKTKEVDFTKADVEAALHQAGLIEPGAIPTNGVEMFGPEKDIPVVALKSTKFLNLQRDVLEAILLTRGIKNGSEFKDYKPHITIKNKNIDIPESVTLQAPVLWWGKH